MARKNWVVFETSTYRHRTGRDSISGCRSRCRSARVGRAGSPQKEEAESWQGAQAPSRTPRSRDSRQGYRGKLKKIETTVYSGKVVNLARWKLREGCHRSQKATIQKRRAHSRTLGSLASRQSRRRRSRSPNETPPKERLIKSGTRPKPYAPARGRLSLDSTAPDRSREGISPAMLAR